MPHNAPTKTEVTIVGGGLVGLTAAAALASANISCTLIENKDLKTQLEQPNDGRSSAIAYGSYLFLKQIGVWDNLKDKAEPILDIRISDGNSSLFLHYNHQLVGSEPMGYMVANSQMWEVLYRSISKNTLISIHDNSSIQTIEHDAYKSSVILENGQQIDSQLLLACDGKFSKMREHFGIETNGWNYPQTGIVCNVKHEKPHKGVAQERFLPSGPFAILPLKGGHECSLVWTEKSHLAPIYTSMSEKDITTEIAKRFGNYLGKIELSSKVFSYPLSLLNATRYHAERLALAGDAAHAIHPIAGQGFNLGIRDIEALLPLLAKTKALGLDIGNADILSEYEKARQFDSGSLIAITDLLNRLFSNNFLPIKMARRIGLAAVEKLPFLKKQFMQHAMGMAHKN